MFSFRRKPKQPETPPSIRSPSLPDLKNTVQGTIPWPEDLVDLAAIRQEEEDEEAGTALGGDTDTETINGVNGRPSMQTYRQGAAKVSFTIGRDSGEPVMFHKPFHTNHNLRHGVPTAASSFAGEAQAPISQFYMSMATPVEALDEMRHKAGTRSKTGNSTPRIAQRRTKVPPTFNIMVAGSKGTGKSSLLRLLLETAETSPTASDEQRIAMDKFLKDSIKSTTAIQATCVEICESRFDRILLSVIDTPGLEFQEGRELRLERQVNSILRYVDAQYADTMNEESKVVRQHRGDQHIHLCIYMIDPASIMTAEARRALGSLPSNPGKTRSDTTVSQSQPPELVVDTSSEDDSDVDDEEHEGLLTMSPAEIKVIHRISNRSNVLPVIAHADSLTDEKLQAVKEAVRRGLADAGIDFGVFGPIPKPAATSMNATANGTSNGSANGHTHDTEDEHNEDEEEDGERKSRPVIKLRSNRHRAMSRSRSRRDLSRVAEDERRPVSPDATDLDSVANIRFSAHILAKNDISAMLPFALITPETKKRRRRPTRPTSTIDTPQTPTTSSVAHGSIGTNSEFSPGTDDGHASQNLASPLPASIHSTSTKPYLRGQPEDLKGVFIRKFRWGTVDVLDPRHCDFAALRTAILSTHLKVLKVHTREVLYEKYRTEKLLAKRATQKISEEERKRLLEDLGL